MQHDDLEQAARKICQKRGAQFVELVGEGTFKQTFRVVGADGHLLALKLYKAVSSSGRDQREIRAMQRCKHKNIARLISVDTYRYGGEKFLALTEEFLPGGTLTSKGRLDVAECLLLGAPLIDALAHMASLYLVHRDIKPDNIMFRADGTTPVITDFGIVRDLSESSITPTWAARGPGTPFFASPEQLNNQKSLTDWRSDQFALGVVLAYVTLGDHPYRTPGIPDQEVVDRVSARNRPAEQFTTGANTAGLPVLTRMVAAWPVDRYRKPERLAQAWRNQRK